MLRPAHLFFLWKTSGACATGHFLPRALGMRVCDFRPIVENQLHFATFSKMPWNCFPMTLAIFDNFCNFWFRLKHQSKLWEPHFFHAFGLWQVLETAVVHPAVLLVVLFTRRQHMNESHWPKSSLEDNTIHVSCSHWFGENEFEMTAVGFEPTPLRTGALSQRLRPLGQTVLNIHFSKDGHAGNLIHQKMVWNDLAWKNKRKPFATSNVMLEIHLVWFRKLHLRLHFVQGCCQVCCFRFKSHWHFLTAEPSNKRCNYAICWECVLPRERLQFGAVSFRLRACAWLLTHNNFHPIKTPTIVAPFLTCAVLPNDWTKQHNNYNSTTGCTTASFKMVK